MLEDFLKPMRMLRCTDVQRESGRGYLLAFYLVAPARRAGVIRALAVAGVLLVAAGTGLPSPACAQTATQGGAVGLLLLLAGGPASQAHRDPSVSRQKPGNRASDEAKGKSLRVIPVTHAEKNGQKGGRPVELRDASHGIHP